MTMAKRKLLLVVMAVLLVAALLSVGMITAFAITADDISNYPFRTGENALANAPTWKGRTTSADDWQLLEILFPSTDLTDAQYLAIQVRIGTTGNSSFTVGINGGAGDNRRTCVSTKPWWWVKEDGTIESKTVQGGNDIALPQNETGTILIALADLVNQFGTAVDCTATTTKVMFTANALYVRNFELTIGEIGYYKADGTFVKLINLTGGQLPESTYYCGASQSIEFPPAPASEVYPFAAGEGAFDNVPVWVGDKTQGGNHWQYFEIKVPETNLADVDYFVLQVKTVKGNPGLTVGVLNPDKSGRFDTDGANGNKMKLMAEDETVTELTVQYGSINIGTQGTAGMLILPKSQLVWRWVDGSAQTKFKYFYFTTNSDSNYDFELAVGELGYYTGDPANGGTYHSLLEMPEISEEHPEFTAAEKGLYYVDGLKIEWPTYEAPEPPFEMPATLAYPFATGREAFADAAIWSLSAGDASANWQTMRVVFDSVADLTNATYLAVQYSALMGAPGITYGVEHGNARYSIVGHDGKSAYMIQENGTVSEASVYKFDASNISGSGALLIDLKEMSWQYGSAANQDLNGVTCMSFATNSQYNYNFEIMIGEVGYYTGTPGESDFTFHKLVDLSAGPKMSQYTCTSDKAENRGTIRKNKIDRIQYGEVTLNWTATGKTGGYFDDTCVTYNEETKKYSYDTSHCGSFGIWNGGALGKTEMTTDSYGNEAVKLTSLGAQPSGDPYTATTLADGIKYDWSGKKGIVMWARNDSDVEISFNVEMDVTNPNHSWTATPANHNARHNIKQGGRFYLYDVNSQKMTIYMTRPCVTLPVGFEGWVYMPFVNFYQADWSVGYGAMPRSMFLDANGAMGENNKVTYLAITVFSGSYTNKSFSINNIGAYKTTPKFYSPLVGDVADTIPVLMDLPALPAKSED